MKSASFYIKLALFFLGAVVFAVAAHWTRQRPPALAEAGWPYQVVESLDQAGDVYHALEELPRALADPQSREAALQFQQAIVQRRAQVPAALKEVEGEIYGTERQYKIPKLIFLKGTLADLEQKDQQALHWYEQAIEMKPKKMSIAYVRKGLVHERLGQLKEAEQAFQKAFELNEDAILSHFHYGLFLARSTNRKKEALAEAAYLAELRPVYAKIIREKVEQMSPSSVSKN